MSAPQKAHPFTRARQHLSRRDPALKELISSVGPCTLQPDPDALAVLTRAIVSQLISTKAAASIYARLVERSGGITPDNLIALGEDGLRGVGLSGTKARTVLELADRSKTGRLPLDRLSELTDEEVCDLLLPVRGVGVWTAEMFLIFCLGRPDVLPVGDLGLRAGVKERYLLTEMPTAKELRAMAESWRPYRTVATWYFWRSRGGAVPQSEGPAREAST